MPDSTQRPNSGFLRNYYTQISLFLQIVASLVATTPATLAEPMTDTSAHSLDLAYPYEARDMDAAQTLRDFSRLTGLPVEGQVAGRVTVVDTGGTAADFLDSFADQTGSVWWYDGLTVKLEPLGNMRSVVIGTRGLDISTLDDAMDFVGLKTDRFTTRMSADGTLFNVVGPAGYVSEVESLIEQIITARKTRRAGLPVVYRGEFAANRDERPGPRTQAAPAAQTASER